MTKDTKQPASQASQSVQVTVNQDTTPILFTDNIFITTNEDGVVLDVAQKLGSQSRLVARIGMSRTHAKKFIAEASRLLALTESKGGKE